VSEKHALSLLDKYGDRPWSRRFVFWSGGRDSTVVLHLALRVWKEEFKAVFIDTGITLPELWNT